MSDSSPSPRSVYDHLLFGLSLPERALRGTSAVVAGAIHESSTLLLPQAFRDSRCYTQFVQMSLNFMIEDVGRVDRPRGEEEEQVEGFVARKTVGSFIELAGMAALHLSPILVLAVVSDVAYGSSQYLEELSAELKEKGVIDQNSTVANTSDLLEAVSSAAGTASQAFDTPPLSVEGLKETVNQTREAVNKINPMDVLPEEEIGRLWNEMHSTAKEQNVGVMDVSTAMAMVAVNRIGNVGKGVLSGVTVAGNMFDRHIMQHYQDALTDIHVRGYYQTFADASGPYIGAVWKNFSSDNATITEDLFSGRLIGRTWSGLRTWWSSSPNAAAAPEGVSAEQSPEESSNQVDSSDQVDDPGNTN